MRCFEAWEPVEKCFDPSSFECIDFHGLSQIIASLTRESLAEREAEIGNLPWIPTEKDNALAKCRLGLRAWRTKKPMLCLHAVTDEDGHPLENEDKSGRRLCEYWSTSFQAHNEGERHHHKETIPRYVQKAPDDIRWTIDKKEFDELIATKESAPDPDGIPYGLYRYAGGLGLQFLRTQTCSGGWRHPCAICREQKCLYPQVLRRRQQWKDRVITGSPTPVDAVRLRLQDTPRCESLLNWLSDNCEDLREMKVVKYAKYVGTMIGPEGHIDRWTAPRKKIIQHVLKIKRLYQKPGSAAVRRKDPCPFCFRVHWIHICT